MRFCKPHWEALTQAIKDNDLEKFISKDGKDAIKRIVNEAEEGAAAENFDPLMWAHNLIVENAVRCGGPYILITMDENGNDYCPLCEAEKHGVDSKEWIRLAANAQVETARELGLIPRVQ